jgi:hypothetical protein
MSDAHFTQTAVLASATIPSLPYPIFRTRAWPSDAWRRRRAHPSGTVEPTPAVVSPIWTCPPLLPALQRNHREPSASPSPASLLFRPSPSGNGRWRRPLLEGRACRALRGALLTLARWWVISLNFGGWWCTDFGFCWLYWRAMLLHSYRNFLINWRAFVLCIRICVWFDVCSSF